MSKLNRLLLLLKYTANVQDDPGPTVLSGLNIHPAEMQDKRSEKKEIKTTLAMCPGKEAACIYVST